MLLPCSTFVIIVVVIAVRIAAVHGASYGGECRSSRCGEVQIRYPFYGITNTSSSAADAAVCGYPGFGINCTANVPILTLPTNSYVVKFINYSSKTITLVDNDVAHSPRPHCPRASHNLTIDDYPLTNPSLNLAFYFNCSDVRESIRFISCLQGSDGRKSYVFLEGSEPADVNWVKICKEKVVAAVMEKEINLNNLAEEFGYAMRQGFELDWRMRGDCGECEASGGYCGYKNASATETVAAAAAAEGFCYCEDGKVAAVRCKGSSHDLVLCSNELYAGCANLFSCGRLQGIGYPFWGGDRLEYCGHPEFRLDCRSDGNTSFTIGSSEYFVKDIFFENQTLKIARQDYLEDVCPLKKVNTTLDFNIFRYSQADEYLTLLYNCTSVVMPNHYDRFICSEGYEKQLAYTGLTSQLSTELLTSCSHNVMVPVLKWVVESLPENMGINGSMEALKQGFEVVWMSRLQEMCHGCELTHGRCGYDLAASGFICLCGDGSDNQTCSGGGGMKIKTKLIIGFSVCGGTALIMFAIFFFYQRRRKTTYAPSSYFTRNISSDPSSVADPEKMGALYGVKFFTYDELDEATDSFNDNREIGDGGFGTVYLGKLQDGRTVAVKRLYENNYKRVEQFLNEVEILTRLRHKNLVTLYGCTSRHSRELLLVYEYISNGTVADHLHGRNAKPGSVHWGTRLKIAVETASALKYLHASDIIHRDVKTNNILLDDNFSVKVADFGLSRLFPLDVTHVSTAPQGTPGYVDPEYHQCYQLTDKSDVYSFGVVLVELISSKPAVDITRHRHEINLSNMALNKIQNGALQELVDPSLGFDTDSHVQKTITAVAELAFQCLQSDKDMRPTMQQVLEILTRIQCGEDSHNTRDNAEELDIFSDEFVLLKSGPLPLSPDSVTVKWVSGSNASNSSC